jgi:hypothetical protein
MTTTIEEIKEIINTNNIDYEVYRSTNGTTIIDFLHSDYVQHVDISIYILEDDDIIDAKVINMQDYLQTLEANSCITWSKYSMNDINEKYIMVILIQ